MRITDLWYLIILDLGGFEIESLNIWLSRKKIQRNDKGQEQMLGQHLYLGERKQEGSRRYKEEKFRELRREQRCFTEAKEEWSLQGFQWHTLTYKWKQTRMNYFQNLFFQMFRTLKITEHPVLQGETTLRTMQKATGLARHGDP